jgi:hypothetical protein
VALNVKAALDAAEEQILYGIAPYVPRLTHFWHIVYPHDYGWWLMYDMQWLECVMYCRERNRLVAIRAFSSGSNGGEWRGAGL